MPDLAFDIDPEWYQAQMRLAHAMRPPGARISKKRERLLVGYTDGVLILAFPNLEVSMVTPGSGDGWFSVNPKLLEALLPTFTKVVRFELGPTTFRVGKFEQAHAGLALRNGPDDPKLDKLVARLDEIAAEQCGRRLLEASKIAETIEWHRATDAVNTTPLLDFIREGSLIVFRLPESPTDAPSRRAVVDRKEILCRKVLLHCHDFQGALLTVDPRWATHVGC